MDGVSPSEHVESNAVLRKPASRPPGPGAPTRNVPTPPRNRSALSLNQTCEAGCRAGPRLAGGLQRTLGSARRKRRALQARRRVITGAESAMQEQHTCRKMFMRELSCDGSLQDTMTQSSMTPSWYLQHHILARSNEGVQSTTHSIG